jgi:hypothetical protein
MSHTLLSWFFKSFKMALTGLELIRTATPQHAVSMRPIPQFPNRENPIAPSVFLGQKN